MAFATLPYPSMDFVPLDILTADELDQIVANINAVNNGSVSASQLANNAVTTAKIADSAVTTAKLASGAVTQAKLDWSSFGSMPAVNTNLVDVAVTSSWASRVTLDVTNIPTGKDFVVIFTGYFRSSTSGAEIAVRTLYNNSTSSTTFWAKQSGSQSNTTLAGMMKYTKVSGVNSAYIQLYTGGTQFSLSDGRMYTVALIS